MIPARASDWVEDSIAWLKDIFGEFGDGCLTKPVCRSHINDDASAWLSLDCTIDRVFGSPEARRSLADVFEIMEQKIVRFAPEMSFEEMMQAVGRMTMRELLQERGLLIERFDELDAALHKIPNI